MAGERNDLVPRRRNLPRDLVQNRNVVDAEPVGPGEAHELAVLRSNSTVCVAGKTGARRLSIRLGDAHTVDSCGVRITLSTVN